MPLFDFIFAKGLMASQPNVARTNASDHWPAARSFRLHQESSANFHGLANPHIFVLKL
jgi:hypothetical protein